MRDDIFTTTDGTAKPQSTKSTHWVVKNKDFFNSYWFMRIRESK